MGGRYSVTSAVGLLPLSLQYGFGKMEEFLRGAHDIDVHWRDAPFQDNIPVLMGLIRWEFLLSISLFKGRGVGGGGAFQDNIPVPKGLIRLAGGAVHAFLLPCRPLYAASRAVSLSHQPTHPPFRSFFSFLPAPCSIWNSTFMGRSSVAVLPYCQALSKFPSHIQQVGGWPGQGWAGQGCVVG